MVEIITIYLNKTNIKSTKMSLIETWFCDIPEHLIEIFCVKRLWCSHLPGLYGVAWDT